MERKFMNPMIAIAIILMISIFFPSCQKGSSSQEEAVSAETSPLSDIQAAVATYLYLPQFSFPLFAAQVFQADVEGMGYDPVNRYLYLSIPRSLDADSAFLSSLSTDPSVIEVASGYEVVDWLGPNIERD
ncbi:MAG: hypothetical protein AAGM67_16600, partial [Bacteroidota bacterium]